MMVSICLSYNLDFMLGKPEIQKGQWDTISKAPKKVLSREKTGKDGWCNRTKNIRYQYLPYSK